MKRPLSLIVLIATLLAGCEGASTPAPDLTHAIKVPTLMPVEIPPTATLAPESQTLTVFAAASLTDAFTEIGLAFDAANPGVTTTFNFAGSQALRTQIEEGAPADVFASASGKEVDTLLTGSFVVADAAQVFLTNNLLVILPADNPAALEKLEDLAKPGIKIILAAEEVPVGKYARQALDVMDATFGPGFKDKVLANVVSNEDNVRQVVAKIQLGEADAGIVYVSDVIATPELKSIEISADLNITARYLIAPLLKSENAELASRFIEYVLSTKGQAILAAWGFASVK